LAEQHTWIGSSTPDSITIGGLDLPSEVMGEMTLTELAYLLVTKRRPTPGQVRVFDAVLVSLADHGLTPSALATRLTHTGAPEAIQASVAAGLRVPGLGHPVHKQVDPRTPRLYELAEQEGLLGRHLRLLEEVAAANERQSGRRLAINGAGAAGAALADLDLPPGVIRGVVLIARTAGLVAHLAEEQETPIGMAIWDDVEGRS
jgi:citrate synthase